MDGDPTDGRPEGLSAEGRALLTRVLGRGRRLVTVDVAVEALEVGRTEAARRLAAWAEQGWLRRVRRGLYVPVPVDAERPGAWSDDPLYLADAVWSLCVVTGWTSANHWGLTDQVFRTTVIKTEQRVRRARQRLAGHEYLLTHAKASELDWGERTEWRHDRRIRIADPARTVVDVLDDPRLGGGMRLIAEIVEEYLVDGDPTLLVDYGDRLGNRAVFKRLGFLVEELGYALPTLIAACLARRSTGIVLLDPSASPMGRREPRWGLRVNVALEPGGVS